MRPIINSIKNYISRKCASIKYQLDFLKVLNSPLKGLRLRWYFGKIQVGTPYFLPRKWVKMTKVDCEESLNRDIKGCLPQYTQNRTWEYYKNHKKPVPIKYFGFHFTTLGWKTKWDNYRFEWNPILSIVIFGKQLAIWIKPNIDPKCMDGIYWEVWLNYEYKTNKLLSKKNRLLQLKKMYSCTWGSNKDGYIDYYPYILKKKYNETN